MVEMEKCTPEYSGMDHAEDKTIILWGQEDLLMTAVKIFLGTEKGLKVIRISEDLDDDTLIREMERLNPDVLIMNEETISKKAQLLVMFAQSFSKIKFVAISLQDNEMKIYNKQTIYINKTSDLLFAIQHDAGLER